jgi:hypothetical protein
VSTLTWSATSVRRGKMQVIFSLKNKDFVLQKIAFLFAKNRKFLCTIQYKAPMEYNYNLEFRQHGGQENSGRATPSLGLSPQAA